MASLPALCEKYFGARDFYEVLKISRTANAKQVKKAYHQLSLLVHPDRVDEEHKAEATEKFKVLGRIHTILSDSEKRKIYDQCGDYDEEGEGFVVTNWLDYWRSLFRKITVEDINNYEKEYKGSETERNDIKRAYMDGKGNMDHIVESVPFANCDEEPRIRSIIQSLVDKDEVPEYKSFTEESEKKKLRRKRRWERDAKEAERMEKLRNEDEEDLIVAIEKRNEARASQAERFFDSLIDKYSKLEESDKKKKKKKKVAPRTVKLERTTKTTKAAKSTKTTKTAKKTKKG